MNPAEHGPRREGSSEQVVPLPRLPWDAPQRPQSLRAASSSTRPMARKLEACSARAPRPAFRRCPSDGPEGAPHPVNLRF
jgi:hypothetical protein